MTEWSIYLTLLGKVWKNLARGRLLGEKCIEMRGRGGALE